MTSELGKLEIYLKGTIETLGPSLISAGNNLGFVVWEQTVPASGHSYQHYEVDHLEESHTPIALGSIVVEQVANETLLMTFGPISAWLDMEPVKVEYVEKYWDFIDGMLRLIFESGFVSLMDAPPDSAGYPTHPIGLNSNL